MSSRTADAVVDVCLTFLAASGLASNTLVLVVFYRCPALRSPSNRFVGSLVLADLVSSTVLAPTLISTRVSLVSLAAGVGTLVATASVFSVVAIAVDRYSAVLSPLHYAMTVTRRRSLAVIALVWSMSMALASPHLLMPCENPLFWLSHSLILLFIGFTFPLIALVLIYARMYAAAHRNSVRTRRHSVSGCGAELDAWRRTSNATFSALLFREEGRAVKTAVMVIASFLFCWTPFFVSSTSQAWGSVTLPPALVGICALSASSLNPFVYVFRNESVRKEAGRVVCWWRVSGGSACPTGALSPMTGGAPPPPLLRHQPSSHCDSMSVQSFQMSTADCPHNDQQPPPADFVATYNPVHGDTLRYESVTFRLAQRRCGTCVRQNSDSSSGSGHPLLTPLPRRQRPSSEPSTPRHLNNNDADADDRAPVVFKLESGGGDNSRPGNTIKTVTSPMASLKSPMTSLKTVTSQLSAEPPLCNGTSDESKRERYRLQRLRAVELEDPGTQV
ncbi:beta-3 adrenergic receptor isoform X2 [Nilaparvata lugens]|uniref:beta-3 adrenergic receptor isoform X2 n=1 Tax=Nilaparvata lugens TaxID=108931 RepID=UPI00193D3087|nr:beta-3 adrenergic receptor isoform X2 [Nilaparvata lugens]